MTVEELIQSNLKLVWHIARKYHRPPMTEIEDLFQTGCIGLVKAAKKFNPRLGYKFTTLAGLAIKREIFKMFNATRKEPPEQMSLYKQLLNQNQDGPEKLTIADMLPAANSVEDEVITRVLIDDFRRTEPIITKLLLQGYTQAEIAQQLGITRGAVFNRMVRFRKKQLV